MKSFAHIMNIYTKKVTNIDLRLSAISPQSMYFAASRWCWCLDAPGSTLDRFSLQNQLVRFRLSL